jgi:diguanylate cyclase (GGDEF)-like protein
MADPYQQLEVELDKLKQEYRARLPEKITALEAAWSNALGSPAHTEYLTDLHLKAHSLAGSGATYGQPALSAAARRLELALKELIQTGLAGFEAEKAALQILFEAVKTAALAPVEPLESAGKATPAALSETPGATPPWLARPASPLEADLNTQVDNRLIWLIEDDWKLADSLAHQLGYFGYKVVCFNRADQLAGIDINRLPAALICDLNHSRAQLKDPAEHAQIERFKQAGLPLIFISAYTNLENRLEAVRLGGKAYLTKPLKTRELIDILDKLTTSQMPAPYQVLIIDDDPSLADLYGVTLRHNGMKTRVVHHPRDVLKALVEQHPDLILMDFHMPGCSGPELAAVIRQQEAYVSIPIVFLSEETDRNQQLAAMGQGGDDFLTKPITPENLVSSITIRAQRSRILREFMVRDSLTGLLNHTETKARLRLEVERAKRAGETLTFAMFDLDHFKQVNDTFGHLAGDGVIKSLSRLLQQRLRKTDIIGRYGGEEFAVILPGTDTLSAEKVLNQVRESFSYIRHQGEKIEFAATFSGGLAAFPQYRDPIQLNAAADQALYQAKAAGRNRLVIAGK